MLLERLDIAPDELRASTGWDIKPEGACKGEECVPLAGVTSTDGRLDARAFADAMGMPLVGDEQHGRWALGPRSGGHVLSTADVPTIVLDDFDGNAFDVARLRGRKVLLVAWASW